MARRSGSRPAGAAPCLRCATCVPAMARRRCAARHRHAMSGAGEIVAVLGSNGVGKTTLNNALSRPDSRRVPARSASTAAAIDGPRRPRSSTLGLIQVPEGRKIFPNLNVRENLELGSYRRAARTARRATSTGLRRSSRGWRSAPGSAPARCPAASSRCSPSAAGSWPSRACSSWTSPRSASRRSSSRRCSR